MTTPAGTKKAVDQDKVEAANQANAKANAEAVKAQDTDENHGKLVVLMSAFVTRLDPKDKTATKRYHLGDEFKPVDGIHDVEDLIRQKVIGRVGDGVLKRTTALTQAKAAAVKFDENSPVIDLTSQPFTQAAVTADGEPVAGQTQPDIDTSNAVDDPTNA